MIDKPPKDPNYSTEHYITSNKGSCSDWLPDFIHHFIYSIWKNTIQTVLLQSLIGTVWSISARKRFLITIPTFSVNFYFRTNVEYDSSTQNMIWSDNDQITVVRNKKHVFFSPTIIVSHQRKNVFLGVWNLKITIFPKCFKLAQYDSLMLRNTF